MTDVEAVTEMNEEMLGSGYRGGVPLASEEWPDAVWMLAHRWGWDFARATSALREWNQMRTPRLKVVDHGAGGGEYVHDYLSPENRRIAHSIMTVANATILGLASKPEAE